MLKDVTLTYRAQPQWNTFETGIEALATTLASLNTQSSVSRKALTIGDLLVKVQPLKYGTLNLLSREIATPTGLQISPSVWGTFEAYACL